MHKKELRNFLIIVVFFLLPRLLFYIADKSHFFLYHRDIVELLSSYTLMVLCIFGGVWLIIKNAKSQSVLLRVLWVLIGGCMVFYGIVGVLFLYGFRHGVGF